MKAATFRYFFSVLLEIVRRLAEELGTPESLRDVSVSLDNVAGIEMARGDLDAALAKYGESLEIRRSLVESTDDPLPQWIEDLARVLTQCRDFALELRDFSRAYEHAVERWNLALSEVDGDDSPRAKEFLLSHACPLLLCELELGKLDDAAQSADLIEGFVDALVAAFEDPEVDREEQGLDSTTLFRCADGLELVARLRAMQGDGEAERGAADAATALREAAERLKAEEDSEGADGTAS